MPFVEIPPALIRSYSADFLWHRLVSERDYDKWKELGIEYLKALLRKGDHPKWKVEAARIILYNHEHPKASYSTIAEEVGCSTTKVIDWLKRWNGKDIKKLKPDTQSRNISIAPLLTIPAITTYVPTTDAIQQIEAIRSIDIESSFAQADSNGEIRYIKDSFENLGKASFKDVLKISTGINLNTQTDIALNTFFFKIGSLNFAIHYFDIKEEESHIMVFGSPDGVNWSQTLIIKGQVEVEYDGTAHINGYRYLSPQRNVIGGLIIPVYQGRWDVWFNPIIHDQPISMSASLTALVYHDYEEIDNISLDPELFHSQFPTLTLPSYVETTEKDFNNLRQELCDTFYSNEIALEDDSLNFLEELFDELIDTLTNPEKLANILAETAIVSPGLYLCWEFVKKIRSFAEKKNSTPLHQIYLKCEKLLSHFERVPKSRIAEISLSMGTSVEEASLLLRLMCFVHQSNCFWHPPLQSKQGNRKKRRKDARRGVG